MLCETGKNTSHLVLGYQPFNFNPVPLDNTAAIPTPGTGPGRMWPPQQEIDTTVRYILLPNRY